MNIVDDLTYLLRAMEATQNAAEIDGEMKARTNIGLDIYRLNGIIQKLANGDDTANEKCTLPVVTPRYFYVVEPNNEEGLDQISVGLESLEKAKWFKDTEYHKKTYPNSFIVCTFNEG